ncbi:unnamed protein product [Litomosoides sigmodontis]|uniref:Uncharacterized protein n=1 Tax=Litomosoides sigmodontis TaxID=42156 RepID=A0A3P6UL20_LITSI|nr:unnamed protein product [Litomosoides sigmodontis]
MCPNVITPQRRNRSYAPSQYQDATFSTVQTLVLTPNHLRPYFTDGRVSYGGQARAVLGYAKMGGCRSRLALPNISHAAVFGPMRLIRFGFRLVEMFASPFATIAELKSIPEDLFYVTVNGKIVDWKNLDESARFQVHFRLRGGKGGFGSLLRSFRIHRSTNQLMCRDLSGRRLADIKEEEKLRKWIEKASEREEEKRRQRQEKYEKLKAGPLKHDFNDPDFIQTRERIMEETDEAFEQGIAVAKNKRTNDEGMLKSKLGSETIESDSENETVLPKRRKISATDTSECPIPSSDEKNKSTISIGNEDKTHVENEKDKIGNEKEKAPPKATVNPVSAVKSTTIMEKPSSKVTDFDINLDDYDNAEKLESLGLDCLKYALEVRGLKCGGSLTERAIRLYSTKNLKPEQYPKNILARKNKVEDDGSIHLGVLPLSSTMKQLREGGDLPNRDLEMSVSPAADSKKNIPMNKNDETEVSAVLDQVEQKAKEAVKVLMKVSEKNEKKMLFPEVDQLLHVQFVYKKPSTTFTGHCVKRFILPYSLYEKGNTTVCLIMRDLDKSVKAKFDPDVDKQARLWSEKLELEFGVTKEHVQKILTKRQLEREYHSYYDRRQLASSYDIFLVDSMIEKSVIRFCGKEFHKAKKTPLRLRIDRHGLLIKEIEKAYYTVTFPLSPYRTRTSLRIGNLSNPINCIVANLRAAVENVFQYCPGGLCNIHSISLQMVTGGPSLSLYISAGARNAVKLPMPMEMKGLKAERDEKAIADELSTLPEGLEVLVYGDGEVKVLDSDTKQPVLYPTVNDEWEKNDDLKPLTDPVKRRNALEKLRKLKEKRKKSREAKNRLLLPLNDSISKIKGLVKKKNKGNSINRFGGVKGEQSKTRTSENAKSHRTVEAKKKTSKRKFKDR